VNGQIDCTRTRNPQPPRSRAPLCGGTGAKIGVVDAHQKLIDRIAELQQPQMRLQFDCRILSKMVQSFMGMRKERGGRLALRQPPVVTGSE
jgi:hypothetical protein